jgi:hypothetical protein
MAAQMTANLPVLTENCNWSSNMTTHAHTTLRNIALLMILTTAGCKSGCNPTKQTSPGSDPVQLTGTGPTYVEMTAAAAAPTGGGACKDGMIVVASGSAGGGPPQLLMGQLQAPFPRSYDLAGWDYGSSLWAKRGSGALNPPPTPVSDAPEGSDNQAARLANGDLLVMWNGSTKSALPGGQSLPLWWSDWGSGGMPSGLQSRFPTGARDGYRPAQVFWRYSCSNGQWSATPGILDSGSAVVMTNGPNQTLLSKPGYCAELYPWGGGFDRPELFVDPWGVDPNDNSKQRILVSTRCLRSDDDSTQIFTSPDSGVTWDPSGIRLPASTPIGMTSTSNGRVLLFQASGVSPLLHWSDDKGKSLASPEGGYDITFQYVDPIPGQPDPHAGEQKKFEIGALGSNDIGVGPPQAPTLSLARTGTNAAMAVYPAVENTTVNGKSITRQVAAVVWVLTKGKDQDPVVVPIKIIRATADEGSVLMATFIEDDNPDQKVATSLLYWLETASKPASSTDAVKMSARYIVFSGIVPSQESILSDAGGWETKNRTVYDALGDYMKGAFYSHAGMLNFVPVWPQVPSTSTTKDTSQVFMRVISFTPDVNSVQPAAEKMVGARPAKRAAISPKTTINARPVELKLRPIPQIRKP